MASKRKNGKEALEAAAAAFLDGTESPRAPRRLREYGLQRVLARARSEEAGKAPATARRAYRNPSLLRHALVVTVAVLLVMLVSTSGAYAFSLDAQPDSTLYGAKIFFERARVTLNPSSAGDMQLEMGFSERRMEELRNMTASGNAAGSERWLREYSRNIEGAGVSFEAVSGAEAERLSSQFQQMLDRHAEMMLEMRRGTAAGLDERIEGAYRVCDQERARMRRRCGQQDAQGPGPAQEPGGEGQGNCPRSGEPSLPEKTTSGSGEPSGVSTGSRGSGSLSGDGPLPGEPSDAADAPADGSADPTPSGGAAAGEGSRADAEMGYQGDSPRKGHMP